MLVVIRRNEFTVSPIFACITFQKLNETIIMDFEENQRQRKLSNTCFHIVYNCFRRKNYSQLRFDQLNYKENKNPFPVVVFFLTDIRQIGVILVVVVFH